MLTLGSQIGQQQLEAPDTMTPACALTHEAAQRNSTETALIRTLVMISLVISGLIGFVLSK